MTSDPLSRYLRFRSRRASTRLRPMSSAELFEDAIAVYQSYGTRILGGIAGSTVLCAAAAGFAQVFLLPSLFQTSDPSNVQVQASQVAFAFLITLVAAAPLFMAGLAYSSAVIAQVSADFILGKTPDVASAERTARTKTWQLVKLCLRQMPLVLGGLVVGTALLMLSAQSDEVAPSSSAMIAGIGVLALVVSGIMVPVVLCRTSLAPAIVIFEGLPSKQACRRSVELLRGRPPLENGYGALFSGIGTIFILGLIGNAGLAGVVEMAGANEMIGGWFSQMSASDLWNTVTQTVYWYLTLWFVVPIWCVTTTLLYFERRARVEGYDIEVLASHARRGTNQARFQL